MANIAKNPKFGVWAMVIEDVVKLHKAGLNQRQIADELNVSRTSVCDYLATARFHGLLTEDETGA
jgi:orotate phosphoribosyltransferase-like protein